MGCVHTKKRDNVEALGRQTLLTSRPRHKAENDDKIEEDSSASSKLNKVSIRSSPMEDSTTCETDGLTRSATKHDFVATDLIPSLLFPLPPTATITRPLPPTATLPTIATSPQNTNIENAVRSLSGSGGNLASLSLAALHEKIAVVPDSIVKERMPDMETLRSSISAQTADSCVKPGSVRSNLSASTTFTFAPPQSSHAIDGKLAVVTEEELDATHDTSQHKRRDSAIPDAPDLALALENALHSVVGVGECLWVTCSGVDSAHEEDADEIGLLRRNDDEEVIVGSDHHTHVQTQHSSSATPRGVTCLSIVCI
mmetsp:Transcript_81739/g.128699  ORF Transcript_81739/g.128699 Transcript_81739/m.128699 type:complete len:312 (-) Transcript_81739:270-1205(-)